MDELLEVGVNPPGDPGKECAEHEGEDLVLGRIDAHGFGGDFIVAHGEEAPAADAAATATPAAETASP